jgi:hypothetical protein
MWKYFSVGSTAKRVAAFLQISSKLAIVVDLAVQDYGDAFIFIEGWLFSSDEIDDGKPAHSEGSAIGGEEPFRVRTAVNHALAH